MYSERLRLCIGWCRVRSALNRGDRRSEVAAPQWRRFSVREPNVFKIRQPSCLAVSQQIPTNPTVVSRRRILPLRSPGSLHNRNRIHGRNGPPIQYREGMEDLSDSVNVRRAPRTGWLAKADKGTTMASEIGVHVARDKAPSRTWGTSPKVGIWINPGVDLQDPKNARMPKSGMPRLGMTMPHDCKEI